VPGPNQYPGGEGKLYWIRRVRQGVVTSPDEVLRDCDEGGKKLPDGSEPRPGKTPKKPPVAMGFFPLPSRPDRKAWGGLAELTARNGGGNVKGV
jgi:hypothetical protein